MTKRKITRISMLSLVLFCTIYLCVCFFSYKLSITNLKQNLTNGNYKEAKLIVSKNKLNIISKLKMNEELSSFFVDYLGKLNDEYLANKLSQEDFLLKISSIESFNVATNEISRIKDTLPIIATSKENFDKGVALYNEKKYDAALDYLNKVNALDNNYIKCLSYKDECINVLKDDLLKEIDTYVQNENYSEGIDLIESNLDKYNHNIDLLNKLDEIEKLRINHLVEYSKENADKSTPMSAPVSAYYNKLSTSTINNFDITSQTNYLVFVNIAEQKTYIFRGSKNKWALDKEFLCSTGIEGKETPVGVFTAQTRAPWFFAPKYGQGGKYYIQFMDNYLFHSVPYAQDQETVIDETLGKPASHGCIRLALENAKWLYDNVGDGSKIIIY